MNIYKFHPLADLFPLMEGAEFDELVADIKAHGLRETIVLHGDKILDGRNRYRACIKAGVEPEVRSLRNNGAPAADSDLAAYVISANIHRRHLTAEQKRELIAKLLKAAPEKSDRQIAKTAKVSHHTVGTVRAKMEASGGVGKLPTRKDTKGRAQPAKKSTKKAERRHKAREYREAKEKRDREAAAAEWPAEIAADQAEAKQIAADLIKLDRNLAQRLHAHLGEGMWLKDALRRGLEGDAVEEAKLEGNGADPTAPYANDDGLDIPEYLKRVAP